MNIFSQRNPLTFPSLSDNTLIKARIRHIKHVYQASFTKRTLGKYRKETVQVMKPMKCLREISSDCAKVKEPGRVLNICCKTIKYVRNLDLSGYEKNLKSLQHWEHRDFFRLKRVPFLLHIRSFSMNAVNFRKKMKTPKGFDKLFFSRFPWLEHIEMFVENWNRFSEWVLISQRLKKSLKGISLYSTKTVWVADCSKINKATKSPCVLKRRPVKAMVVKGKPDQFPLL